LRDEANLPFDEDQTKRRRDLMIYGAGQILWTLIKFGPSSVLSGAVMEMRASLSFEPLEVNRPAPLCDLDHCFICALDHTETIEFWTAGRTLGGGAKGD